MNGGLAWPADVRPIDFESFGRDLAEVVTELDAAAGVGAFERHLAELIEAASNAHLPAQTEDELGLVVGAPRPVRSASRPSWCRLYVHPAHQKTRLSAPCVTMNTTGNPNTMAKNL